MAEGKVDELKVVKLHTGQPAVEERASEKDGGKLADIERRAGEERLGIRSEENATDPPGAKDGTQPLAGHPRSAEKEFVQAVAQMFGARASMIMPGREQW